MTGAIVGVIAFNLACGFYCLVSKQHAHMVYALGLAIVLAELLP